MTYTISQFKDSIARELHGRTTDRLQDVYETAYDASLILLSEIDPKETERMVQVSPQVFDDIDVYSSPADYKSAIDLVPSAGLVPGLEYQEDFRRTSARQFGQRRNNEAPMIAERWINGTRFLLIRKYPRNGQVIQLDSMDSTTPWVAGYDAWNLEENNLNYIQGGASLSITLTHDIGSGSILATNLTPQDLTDYRLLSSYFIKVYIPSGFHSRFTSFFLRHGNDNTANYWEKSVTVAHDGTAFKDGWNLLRFDWSSATEIGTVDETVMDSARIGCVFTTGSDIPGVLFDNFTIQKGTMYDLYYHSNYLFQSTAGVWKDRPTADDDIINLSSDSFKLFTDIGALCAMSEVSSKEKEYEKISKRVGWPVQENNRFAGSLGQYKRQNPSQRLMQTETLHDFGV